MPRPGQQVYYCEDGYISGPYRFRRAIGDGLAEVLDSVGRVLTSGLECLRTERERTRIAPAVH